MKKGTILRIRGLRQRWLLNTMLPVILAVATVLTLFSAGMVSYYYSGLRSNLEAKAKSTHDLFSRYAMNNYSEYYQMASYYTENFEAKDRLELQFINTSGRIQVSAYGLTAGMTPNTQDILDAIELGEISHYRGPDLQTGEAIMAISVPLEFENRVVGIMRFVTSMQTVNRQLGMTILLAILIGLACLVLVLVSNLSFIRNVVQPVAEVTAAAKRISHGSYGVQLENRYSDELGELVESINDMSRKISRSEKMKSEFIASVSHELRTPLTAISGWGETLLVDGGESTEQLDRGLHIILKESRRLSVMVEELLEFSKLEDGRFTLQMEPVDLQAELEDAVFTYRELFRQEGILVEYEAQGESTPPVMADPERLKQVFCNLLDNAAKHGGSGGKITIHFSVEENFAIIRIRDHGPGIPEADLPFIKQKFFKGASRARGSGIGLAVCDEIVSRHGGELLVGNAWGGGAVVTVRLPLENG